MNEDEFCMSLAKEAARFSTCNKKHLGCIILTERGDITLGYNGPPEPLEKCNPCPRLNSHSVTDLHLCRAVHAERYALLECARQGYSTVGAVLYSYMCVPCSNCMVELIAAGVSEIVCIRETYYDELSKSILKEWISKGGKFRVLPVEEEAHQTVCPKCGHDLDHHENYSNGIVSTLYGHCLEDKCDCKHP